LPACATDQVVTKLTFLFGIPHIYVGDTLSILYYP
jgi:hypothetical protein